VWAAAASGFSDPMTTRGDIIYRDATNTTARLAAGAATYVLTSDGTDIAWAAAGGSSPWTEGAGVIYPTTFGTDDVVIGANSMTSSERFRVVGDALFDNRVQLLATSSSTVGVITLDGLPFIHAYKASGTDGQNIFIGGAGNFSLGGGIPAAYEASRNVGLGLCLRNIDLGFGNMATGNGSLDSLVDGFNNFAGGLNSLQYCVDGVLNVGLGQAAGRRDITDSNVTDPNNCTFIGGNTKPSSTSPTYQILIGSGVDGRSDYSFVIGGQNNNTGYLSGDTMVMGIGDGGATVAEDIFLRGPDLVTGGAGNVDGADLTFSPGLGTGTGIRGKLILETPRAAAAGDNLQTRSALVTLDEEYVGIGTTTPDYTLQVNGEVVPETTGQDLGTSSLRWDSYMTNVDINGTITVDGSTGLNGTYNFNGVSTGEVLTMTFTDGIATAVTQVP
jgi:hypothetical protein